MENNNVISFAEKIALLNELIKDKELGYIFDYDNPEFVMSEVYFDADANKVFTKFEVVEEK